MVAIKFSHALIAGSLMIQVGLATTAAAQSETPENEQIVVRGETEYFGWREAKTQHFIIYADMPIDKLADYARDMETYDAALREFVGDSDTAPVTIFSVSTADKVQQLYGKGGSNVLGFYNASAQGAFAVVPETSIANTLFKLTAKGVLFHEYAHHLTLSSTDELYPGWLTEGLAEFFGTATIDDNGEIIIGAPNSIRGFSIQELHRWTVQKLFESDLRTIKKDEVEQKYSKGWLLIHYLFLGGQRNSGQLVQYIKYLNAGMAPLKAGEKAFGDLNKLEKELERYRRSSKFNTLKFKPKKLKNGVKVEIRNLSEGASKIMPSRMRSAVGVNFDAATQLVQKARPISLAYIDDPFVQRAMAEMEYDARNWDDAGLAADRVLAIQPANIMAIIYKGRVYAQNAIINSDPNGWRMARTHFLKANQIDPNFALPFVLYYDSFAASGEKVPEDAFVGLLRAVVLVPQDESIKLRIGYHFISSGELKSARDILAPVAFNPHASSDNQILDIVRGIDAGASKSEIMQLAKKAKLDEVSQFYFPNAKDRE